MTPLRFEQVLILKTNRAYWNDRTVHRALNIVPDEGDDESGNNPPSRMDDGEIEEDLDDDFFGILDAEYI